jgi:hypothetical protein
MGREIGMGVDRGKPSEGKRSLLTDLFHTVKVILLACPNPADMMKSESGVVTDGRAKVQLQ